MLYYTNLRVEQIDYNRYFEKYSKGKNAIEIVKEIKSYLNETYDFEVDTNHWKGNHAFLNDCRNQMTHRVSPSVSSISTLGIILRHLTMYVLYRATEDYYMVSHFLCKLINIFLEERKDWLQLEGLEHI